MTLPQNSGNSPLLADVIARLAERSASMTPEAQYYWLRHEPRYRYVAAVLQRLNAQRRFARILDVGMGFEVPLLSELFPAARVDCVGTHEDPRFLPDHPFTFFPVDLNHVATQLEPPGALGAYDLIVFMEVLEHLYIAPDRVLRYLAIQLAPEGTLLITTPNAAWLKNRLKMARGQNPFERLKADPANMGHIREYTKPELEEAITAAGLECVRFERRGLYAFNNAKDNFYSALADLIHPSLSRTLVAVCRKKHPTTSI